MSRKTTLTHHRAVPVRSLILCGLAAAALAGCATPDYPIKQGYTPPPPIKPKYPIDRKDQTRPATPPPASGTSEPPSAPSAASDSAAQTESAPSQVTAAPAPAPVESAPLDPLPPLAEAAPGPAGLTRVSTEQTPVSTEPVSTAPAAATPVSTAPAATTPTPTSQPPAAAATTAPAATPPAAVTTQSTTRAAAPPPAAAYRPPAQPAYTPPRPERRTETRLTTDGKVVAARGMYRDYEVRDGDHLDAIARDLETTREELIRANRLKKPYRLHPGEHIKAPVAKAYVAQSGDSLTGVAKRFGVGLGELADLNDLPSHGRLAPGMYIALPAHFEDHGPSRETFTQEVYERPAYRPQATYPTTRPQATYPTTRPQATYPTASRAPEPAYVPGSPYSPSAEALAAANARREALARPTPTYPTTTESARPEAPVDTTRLASLGVGKFIWPVRGSVVSSFGASGMGRRNDGVDIGAAEGSEVKAAAVGEVVYAGDQVPGFGNLVLIKHAGGWVSAYAHLGQVDVRMRDTVYQGQQIGTVGQTGGASQPELHFELRYAATPEDKAKPLDPLLVLPKMSGAGA
ncbi:MAG TPA: peptidoglycan DD-metalloendopeptidase family protein [Caulobacteraceae bacterium]|nr:peptidoglycan DD-metalloendopeptidase family protein [Caulobacteraceae bacterium]